ncbi:hypothetical protein HMPREF9469_00943 [ [[Clostridium] citroniae WAL-17108]|uniref:Uncharacterized protein n=1 Tax=[Clostridium] citroniae WAL-17108 TaxID=742733 RepID=G5HES0_9FIRM|nr:hypothetical protein HMPREF9469_00943 [ [[Clostridium] citroniae WAL-17108]MCC3383288.1 hypothetical protein [Enterocloster citroniae]DAT42517.1 MAG TPA: hypothetical protein [Caudoviricetes sp.]
MPQPFIKTSDCETAKRLLDSGFVLISEVAGIYTFVNDASKSIDVKFANDLKKLSFSNKLEI